MKSRTLLPLIDFVLLSLGAILALITQMDLVRSIPIDLIDAARGAVSTDSDGLMVVAIDSQGFLWVGQELVLPDQLPDAIGDAAGVLLRVDKAARSESVFGVIGQLRDVGVGVEVQVDSGGIAEGGR